MMPRRLALISLLGCLGCSSSVPLATDHSPPIPHTVWSSVDTPAANTVDPAGSTQRLPTGIATRGNHRSVEQPLERIADASPEITGMADTQPDTGLGDNTPPIQLAEYAPSDRRPAGSVIAVAEPLLIEPDVPAAEALTDKWPAAEWPAAVLADAAEPADNAASPSDLEPPTPTSIAALIEPPQAAPETADAASPIPAEFAEGMPMNLPSALASVGGQHPIIGIARWRVREAYAELEQARTLWLPTIQSGFGFHRHDGNYQASDGRIVDVNRNSFQYGLGVGATGAGTTPQPGLVARFHFADAIFQPRIAEKTAWARGHAAGATLNRQLRDAAIAYINLLAAHQDVAILAASEQRTEELAKLTADFAAAGEGLQADADRLQTELALVNNRSLDAQRQLATASARLAEAISLNTYETIVPMDPTIVPLDMVAADSDRGTLISTGLSMRPELKESQALVAAACEAYRREKLAPFIPSVLLGFSTGGFGGGLGNTLDNIDSRYDFDAMMAWQVRNLGLGEHAARSRQTARVQQAKFEHVRVMDQIAREIAEGHASVQFRRQQIEVTRRGIETAQQSYDRNVKRIRDGEGLPLEVLQSLQALESADRAYLQAVADYNRSQFELQWAQGWPVQAPTQESP